MRNAYSRLWKVNRAWLGLWVALVALPAVAMAPAQAAEQAAPRRVKVLFLGDTAGHKPLERFKILQPVFAKRGIELTYTDKLDDLNKRTKKKDPVLVHLRAHALTRGDQVYVIPGNASPDDPNSWMNLKELLDLLAQNPAAHRMLLLDLSGPIADPILGQLEDDVSARVRDTLESRADKKLTVLLACDRGADELWPLVASR